jgi:teichuronic acid biosynthesis glycosyltransferase TuaH
MQADFDIIFLSLTRWDGPYASTAYALAKELAKKTRVFYIDNPYTWKDVAKDWGKPDVKKRRNALLFGKDHVQKISDQLYFVTPKPVLPINYLPDGMVYQVLSKYNNQIVSTTINKLIDQFGVKRFVLINSFDPFYFPLTLKVKPLVQAYQSVDNIEESAYVAKHGGRKEKEIAQASDFVFTTSSQLTNKLRPFSKQIECIPNAADILLFSTALTQSYSKPAEWEKIGNKKVILYTGNICHRVDYPLLLHLAKSNPDKVLLMVGPSKDKPYEAVGLQMEPNVLFAGSKKPEELPAYLQHSHAAIIPFLCNKLTASIYPLKINEYLAAGKPVVATPFSEDILAFKDIISLCDTKEAFAKAVSDCIQNDSPELQKARNLVASENTWQQRSEVLLHKLIELVSKAK